MPKKKRQSRIRYELANPTITIRVTRDQYDRLDYIRQSEMVSWKDLFLRVLEKPKEKKVQIGTCSGCGKGYMFTFENVAQKRYLDNLVSKDHPLCRECRENGQRKYA